MGSNKAFSAQEGSSLRKGYQELRLRIFQDLFYYYVSTSSGVPKSGTSVLKLAIYRLSNR